MKKQVRDQEQLETYLLRELAVLNYVRHENMLEYIGAYNEVDPQGATHAVYIVTELAAGGDLMSLLLSEHELGWKFLTKICHGAAAGLEYLHSHNLIHRDIKSSNLLLDARWTCKIADFGLCREVAPDDEQMSTCGTDEYMAPELHFDEPYGFAVDVFSFGMVLVECLARRQVGAAHGFCARQPSERFQLDFAPVRELAAARGAPDALVALCEQCTHYEVCERPITADVTAAIARLADALPDDAEPEPPLPSNQSAPPESADPPAPAPSEAEAPPPAGGADACELHAGWLYKRHRTKFKNWKRRWFVLREAGTLEWHNREVDPADGAAAPLGRVALRGCQIDRAHPTFHRYRLTTAVESRRADGLDRGHSLSRIIDRELSAGTEEEMREWVRWIRAAIAHSNNTGDAPGPDEELALEPQGCAIQ